MRRSIAFRSVVSFRKYSAGSNYFNARWLHSTPITSGLLDNKIAILGTGNIGLAIAKGIATTNIVTSINNVTLTRRNTAHQTLQVFKEKGFQITNDNIAAINNSDTLILAVTPQQLNPLLKEISPAVTSSHNIISVVTGVSISHIQQMLGFDPSSKHFSVIRCMPNTAIAYQESMTCVAIKDYEDKSKYGHLQKILENDLNTCIKIFQALGETFRVSEEQIIPATALCACGIAFFSRAIRAASQGGVEVGFHAHDAIFLAAQTAKGAATLLLKSGLHPEAEVDKVTTPQGVTIAGLNQMEHSGFSSAFIKGILTSSERAHVLAKQAKEKK